MELRRWFNPHQPQTLQTAVFLLYIRAVLAILPITSSTYGRYWGDGVAVIAGLVMALSALGIANDKRWGWRLAIAVTVVGIYPLVIWLIRLGPGVLGELDFLLLALWPTAQLALLLHPMSRDHQRIWFT